MEWNKVTMATVKNGKVITYKTNLCPVCDGESLIQTNFCPHCGVQMNSNVPVLTFSDDERTAIYRAIIYAQHIYICSGGENDIIAMGDNTYDILRALVSKFKNMRSENNNG